MAFVKVKKDNKQSKVPSGSVKQYLAAGWELVEEADKKPAAKEVKEESIGEETQDDSEWDDAEWEEEDEDSRLEELEEKPLSEMNNKELREYADLKGVNLVGLTSNKQIREAISSALK